MMTIADLKNKKIYPIHYELIDMFDIETDITSFATELQKNEGIRDYENEDYIKIEMPQETKDAFNELSDYTLGYIIEDGVKKIVPVLFDNDYKPVDITLDKLLRKIEKSPVYIEYLVYEGKTGYDSESGPYYIKEPETHKMKILIGYAIDLSDYTDSLEEYINEYEMYNIEEFEIE